MWVEKLFLVGAVGFFSFSDPMKINVSEIQYGREISGFSYNYSPQDEMKYIQEFPRMAELLDKKPFNGKTGLRHDVETRCGFVAENPDNEDIIVAIRGTDGLRSFSDWAINFKQHQITPEYFAFTFGPPKKMHAGFYRYAHSMIDPIWEDISRRLMLKFSKSEGLEFDEFLKNIKISLYGHSTGGSTSQIMALMIQNKLIEKIKENSNKRIEEIYDHLKGNIRVFSYAAPKVFNPSFAELFDQMIGSENHLRMVQKSKRFMDPITMFPLGNFKHTGTLCRIELDEKNDRQQAGIFRHNMISNITPVHLKSCMDENN